MDIVNFFVKFSHPDIYKSLISNLIQFSLDIPKGSFTTAKVDRLLISVTSVLLILIKMFPISRSMITQVAEHVIVQANEL